MVDAPPDAGGRTTGSVPIGVFFSSEFNKNGTWLDSPEAVRMRAISGQGRAPSRGFGWGGAGSAVQPCCARALSAPCV